MRTLERIGELTHPRNLGLFVWACVSLLAVSVALTRHPLPAVLVRLSREQPGQPPPPPAEVIEMTTRLRRYLNFLLLSVLRTSRPCLRRTLVLFAYCRRAGLPVQIHIGVRLDDGSVQSHAWLTLDGNLFQEQPAVLSGLQTIYSHPDSSGRSPGP